MSLNELANIIVRFLIPFGITAIIGFALRGMGSFKVQFKGYLFGAGIAVIVVMLLNWLGYYYY